MTRSSLLFAAVLGSAALQACKEPPIVVEAKAGLVKDATELAVRRSVRPVHQPPPTKGSFADALAPHRVQLANALASFERLSKPMKDDCDKALADGRPSPRECLLLTEGREGIVQAVVDAARREDCGPHRMLVRGGDPKDDFEPEVAHVLRLEAWFIEEAIPVGKADEAAQRCVDSLALIRDMTYREHMTGALRAAQLVTLVFHACEQALGQASPEARTKAAASLQAISEGLNEPADALKDWCVVQRLNAYGHELRKSDLPEHVVRFIQTSPEKGRIPIADAPKLDDTCLLAVQGTKQTAEVRRSTFRKVKVDNAAFGGHLPDMLPMVERYEALFGRFAALRYLANVAGRQASDVPKDKAFDVELLESPPRARLTWLPQQGARISVVAPLAP